MDKIISSPYTVDALICRGIKWPIWLKSIKQLSNMFSSKHEAEKVGVTLADKVTRKPSGTDGSVVYIITQSTAEFLSTDLSQSILLKSLQPTKQTLHPVHIKSPSLTPIPKVRNRTSQNICHIHCTACCTCFA